MRKVYLFIFALLCASPIFAQLTGTKNIPGDYPDLNAAITDLNTVGVGAGGVVLNLVAGNPQTAPAGGYQITASGTVANTITLQGNSNTITASGALTVGSLSDGIIKIIGGDYITIQGFSLLENGANTVTTAASNTMTEWGIALLYATTTNGAQNITIQNNTITLNRTYANTFGIYSNSNHSATTVTTSASATTSAGGNSGMKVYGNTISNVNNGIAVVGPLGAAADANTGIDIGGSSPATGNTITNYGTTGTFSAYIAVSGTIFGILVRNATVINVSYNTITSSGANAAGTLRGIYVPSFNVAPTGTFTNSYNNNTISLTTANVTGALQGITVESTTGTATSTTNINNNNFTSIAYNVASPSGAVTIINYAMPNLNTNITGNTFTNLTTTTTGSVTFISHSFSMPANGSTTISNNSVVTGFSKTGAGGTVTFATTNGSSPNGTTATYSNNTFSNVTVTGATGITGINNTDGSGSSATKTITSNSFTNWTGGTSSLSPINVTYIGAVTSSISNNTITDITGQSTITALSVGSSFSGATTLNIANNLVARLSSTGTGGTVTGITCSNTSTTININNNSVHTLSSTGASSAVTGIVVTGASTTNVYNNTIYDLSSAGATPLISGLLISGGTTVNAYNNLIGDLRATVGNNGATDVIRGINITSTSGSTAINISYNTVYINATSTGTNFSSAAVYHAASTTATTASLTMRNNILVNQSTPTGTGLTVVFRRSSGAANTLNNYNVASNNNLFYAGTPGAANLIYSDGTSSAQTLAAYKTGVFTAGTISSRDQFSVTEMPPFLSTNGADATFLHINPAVATQVESGGTPIAGITTDFDNNTRNSSTPDIGADEGTFTFADISGPAIAYTVIPNTTCLTAPTLSAAITDASSVNVTAGTKPRLYYKRSTDANTFNDNTNATDGWKYVEATNATSPFSFTLNYSLLNGGAGGAAGQTIQYFVVAQDLAASPNVGINSGSFTSAPSSVNLLASSFPVTGTGSFNIGSSLNSSITVGSGGDYPTLTGTGGLFEAINNGGLAANTIAEIISTPITETGAVALNAVAYGCTPNRTLTIRPQAGMAAVLSGTSGAAVSALVKLNGADYVTIDGLNTGGASLLIENTSVTDGTAVIWLASQGDNNGATNNIIRNISIKAGVNMATAATATYGIVIAGNTLSGSLSSISAGDDNDNNRIEGNTITKVRYGLYIRGGSTTDPNMGTVITNNIFGPVAFGAESIGKGAIVVREENGIQITNNLIQNVGGDFANTSAGTDRVGISIATDAVWPPTTVLVTNAVVTNNTITNIIEERTFSAVGIILAGTDGTNVTNNIVANNMISSVRSNGTLGDQSVGLGIRAGNGDKVVFNTINLFGDLDPGSVVATSGSSAGVIVSSNTAVTNLVLKNNIISVDLTSNTSTLKHYVIVAPAAAFAWGTGGLDYNLYYFPTSNTQMAQGGIGTSATTYTTVNTLADWKIVFTPNQDANSIGNIQPIFVSATDLHLVPGANSAIDNLGTPITGVTVDIDGNTRNVSTPDMGADEFSAPACTGAVGGTVAAATTTYCVIGSPAITATGYSIGAGSGYQWQSSADLAFTTPTNIGGQTNPAALIVAAPVTTTTYYRLRVTCTTAPLEAFSNIITITINSNPVANVTPAGPVALCAPATQVLTASSNATSAGYQWKNNGLDIGSATAATYTAATSGNYTVVVTDGVTGCKDTSNAVAVTVTPSPSGVNASATSNSICVGSSVNLSSSSTALPAVILNEDFESGATGWAFLDSSSTGTTIDTQKFHIKTAPYSRTAGSANFTNFSITGSKFAIALSDAGGSGSQTRTFMVTPSFSTQGYTGNATLNFNHVYQFWNSAEQVKVQITTDGITWNDLQIYTASQGTTTSNAQVHAAASVTVPAAYMGQSNVQLRFRYLSNWGYYWAIDDVNLTGTPIVYTYGWTSNPVGFTSAAQNPTGLSPTVTTTYTVTVTGAAGCTSTAQTLVTVSPTSNAGTLNGDQTICTGGTPANIIASGITGNVVRWESSTDAAFSSPVTIANTTSTLSPGALTASTYYRIVVKSGACNEAVSTTPVMVTVSSAITLSTALAGTSGGAQVCANYNVAASNNYFNNCALIATITPSGASPVSGNINACVKVESAVPTAAGTNEPYVARHYNIIPATNAATATSTITLYFLQSEFNAFNAVRGFYPALPTGATDNTGKANLRVSMFPGSAIIPGTAGGVQINPADVDITFADGRWSVRFAATGSGSFFVHTGNFTLPVTLVNFRGEQSGSINRLLWTTSTETNNRGFELERSSDGRNYSSITFIASKAENGNSNSAINYNYNDLRPFSGNNYYRLKQFDTDGRTTISNVVLLSSKVAEITLSSVYPNPTLREVNLVISSPKAERVTIVITDLTGKVLLQKAMQLIVGDNQELFNVQNLAAGTYFIKAVCANGCETAVQRFVKQ